MGCPLLAMQSGADPCRPLHKAARHPAPRVDALPVKLLDDFRLGRQREISRHPYSPDSHLSNQDQDYISAYLSQDPV